MSNRLYCSARCTTALLLSAWLGCNVSVPAMAQLGVAPSSGSPPATGAAQAPVLVELTAANANDLLVGLQGKTFIVAYSSREVSPAQTAQIALITREARNYAGRLPFVRLDVDKYPEVFAALSSKRKWEHGPYFIIVSTNPNFRAILSDNFNNERDPLHAIGSVRLHAEINDFLKLQPAP